MSVIEPWAFFVQYNHSPDLQLLLSRGLSSCWRRLNRVHMNPTVDDTSCGRAGSVWHMRSWVCLHFRYYFPWNSSPVPKISNLSYFSGRGSHIVLQNNVKHVNVHVFNAKHPFYCMTETPNHRVFLFCFSPLISQPFHAFLPSGWVPCCLGELKEGREELEPTAQLCNLFLVTGLQKMWSRNKNSLCLWVCAE